MFFPVFLVLKFVFFIGWLKVAGAINHPFGDDEDDFQIGELISRHVWVGQCPLDTQYLLLLRRPVRSCHSTRDLQCLRDGKIKRWRPWSTSTPSMTKNEEKGDANNYNKQVTINSIPLFTQLVSTPLISSKVDLNLSVPTCRPRSRCPPEPRLSGTCRRCRVGGSCGSALSTCRDRRI